jgi:hypothetical protein
MWSRCAICSHSVTISQAESYFRWQALLAGRTWAATRRSKLLWGGRPQLLTEMLIGLRHGLGRAGLAAQHLALHLRQLAPQ